MADNNIIIRITSEADLDSAQKQLQELTDRAKEQKRELEDLKDAEKEDAKSIKEQYLARDREAKALKRSRDYYRDLRDQKKEDIEATKKSIKALNDQIRSYKTLNGQSGRMVMQLRAMREQLQKMEDAGEFGTKAFVDLSIAAGQLEDQIGDTQQRIRILASDTKEIDAIMGLGDGLAGAFYIATSGAELFGGELEGLQEAFYKVQGVMSILSGTQQMYNALQKDSAVAVVFGTSLEKTKQKFLQKSIAYERLYNIQKATGSATNVAQATTTSLVTKAQWKLNAAMAANPIGAIITLAIAAVAALVGLGVAIAKIVHHFSDAGKAERDYAKASQELEQIQAANAVGASKRAYERQQQIKATDDAEQQALTNAQNRNASEIELAQIKSNYAKKRADEAQKYSNEELARNNKEVAKLQEMVEAKQREVNAYKDGSKKKKKAQEELNDVQQQYYDALQKSRDLEQENADAQKSAADAAQALKDAREQMLQQAQQANIDLMKDGAAKEIAQINLNYKEQLKTVQGNSDEETKLRKALLAKQAKEIAAVRRKYAQQEQQNAIQEQKNLLSSMSQSGGTEADYAEEIALTKKIAEAEAKARINALDKENMSEREYAAQVEAIRLDLSNTLRDIDEQEVQRTTENAKRRTEIEVQAAEARKNALTGAEYMDEQKAVVSEYYATLQKQIEENAEAERQAVERSTDTAEVKAEKIKQINAQMNADIAANNKDAAQAQIDIDNQYLAELERRSTQAADAVNNAQGGDKLQALKANLDAQTELYNAQLNSLDAQYAAGLISYQDYKQQEFEITKEIADAEAQYQADKMQTITDGFQMALDYMQQVSDLAFEALGNNVQAELDALEEGYTTDAEEAKKNANKKYISEKEYEEKKAALEKKQAKYAKAQALINAGINTAMAIITTLAQLGATPWGIAQAAIAGAMGAAQMAIIAAKPLAQYAKGRKGGQGEYALVGEKGAEIMYVPHGASIIPHDKINQPEAWGAYGVPQLPIPASANINPTLLDQAVAASQWQPIDYDRLGQAVAKAMPKQRAVNVNVDRHGVTVQSGNDTRTYLNTKYQAQW